MTGRFIAVVGPSGVGKDSVMAALATHDPRFVLARRVITRPTNAGGEAFDGVTETEFATRVSTGDFALHWSAHGLQYGIPASVDMPLAQGQDVLANLSRAMLAVAAARFARLSVIQLSADKTVLAKRLTARGRETPHQIAQRLGRVSTPLPTDIDVHEVDNNGPLTQTVQTIMACLYEPRGTGGHAHHQR